MSKLPKGWAHIKLKEVQVGSGGSVAPAKFPDEVFELYSVPSYNTGEPELLPGSEIKSAKQPVEPNDVLLCKIVPHIERAWKVRPRGEYRQIASG